MTGHDNIVTSVTKAENNDISTEEAISNVDPQDLMEVLFSTADETETEPLAIGIAASPGAATGKLCSHAVER